VYIYQLLPKKRHYEQYVQTKENPKNRMKLYNTLAIPVPLHGSENWTIKARDASRITEAEMKYIRRTAGYTRAYHKTNTELIRELNVTAILERIYDNKKRWIKHVNRMPRSRLLQLLKTTPQNGKGTQEDRCRGYWMCETATGHQVARFPDS
jgi:hypothetical protein